MQTTTCAAYIIFSIGLIKPFQAAAYPTCFTTHTDCSFDEVCC